MERGNWVGEGVWTRYGDGDQVWEEERLEWFKVKM